MAGMPWDDRLCARRGCGHMRSRHIDRASLPDSGEPCDEDGCNCVEFVSPRESPTDEYLSALEEEYSEMQERELDAADAISHVLLLITEVRRLRASIVATKEVAERYGSIDGERHQRWVVDQMLRALLGARYEVWVIAQNAEPGAAPWDPGIAP